MLSMQYIGDEIKYPVSFKRINQHIVQVTGNLPAKPNGFTLCRIVEDGWSSDCSEYTTVYREIEGGVQFSDDGSRYVTPTQPQEPEPYTPTEDELEGIFEQNKKDKVLLSKAMLAAYLEKHPITSTAHGGVEGVYSVTSEKQSFMMSQYMTYQIEKAVNPDAKLTWNETSKSCEEWTEQEFMQLILEIKSYVYPLISYQQALEEQITACSTQEDLDAIKIDYTLVGV